MIKTLFLFLILIVPLFNTVTADKLICREPEIKIVQDKAQKSTYKNCQRNGMTWWYTDKGTIKSQVNFKNAKENGLYTSFYDNGTKKLVVRYVDGQKNGVQKIYYDNGQLGAQVNYVIGRREGLMKEWDIDGYKTSEVFYKHNYKVGVKKYFNKEGNVIKTEIYKMDRNPVMVKLLKDKRKEIFVDLSKYGLMPKDAPKEQRIR
ncbi:toxin-antitoxin system YwqK family antitoxin [Sulfurimonas sp.]